MITVALTEDTFEDTVTRPGITLIDWRASWCGPCRMFAPVFQAASRQHPDITFGKVDTEDQRGLSAAAQITSIPTLMAFRDGILVFSQPGAASSPRKRPRCPPGGRSTWAPARGATRSGSPSAAGRSPRWTSPPPASPGPPGWPRNAG